jgi:predicted nucleotide-binding protein
MHVNKVRDILLANGLVLDEEREIGYGRQLRFTNGSIVNVYEKGTIAVQGRDTQRVKELLGLAAAGAAAAVTLAAAPAPNNQVFVVYGHDQQARNNLEAMLRRWGLEPLILDQLPSEGQTIIEKLENYTAAVVLATPDDVGHRAGHQDEAAHRARQNVVLELGMLLSKLGRKRVAIILNQQENMERPSDIQGLIYIPYKENLEKEGLLLAKELAAQGYRIDVARI